MSHSRAHGIKQLMSVHAPSNKAGELRSIDGQTIPGPVNTSEEHGDGEHGQEEMWSKA